MFKVEYAALKYYNSIISEECLYIGMLFHNLTTGDRDFRYISNFKRFRAFDDEADVSFIKAYLMGIKTQVENNILNYQDSFSIKEFTRVYVNEFKFTDITTIEIDEQEDYVDNLTRMYLKFDFYLPTYNAVIEYDGEQHYKPVDFANKGKEWAIELLIKNQKRDSFKNRYCEENRIPLLRIPYWKYEEMEILIKNFIKDIQESQETAG